MLLYLLLQLLAVLQVVERTSQHYQVNQSRADILVAVGVLAASLADPGGFGFKSPGWIRILIRNPDPSNVIEV